MNTSTAPPATAEAACTEILRLVTELWGEPEPDYNTSVTCDWLLNKIGVIASSVLKTDAPPE